MKDSTPLWRQMFVVSGPFFSMMGSGCAAGFSATLLPLIMDPSSDIQVTSSMASWIASIIVIGSIIGIIFGPLIMDNLGCKKALLLSTITLLIGWYSIACARSAAVLLLAKLLQGIGVGATLAISILFIGEISTPKYRGAFISMVTVGTTLGIFTGHIIGTLCPWRKAALICSTFNLLNLFLIAFTVESPSWLLTRNKFDESLKTFSWLRGDGEAALKEFSAMVLAQRMKSANENLSSNANCGTNVLEHLNRAAFYKPILIASNLALLFHGTGLDVILNVYCIIILKQLIDDTDGNIDHHTIMLSFDIIKVIACLLAVYIIKAVNRRFVLVANMIVTIILALLFIFSYLQSLHVSIYFSNWIFIGLLCVFGFSMNVGITSFTFPILGEIFPMAYKSILISYTGILSSFVLFAMLKFAPALFAGLGLHGTFLVYALISLFCTLYLYFYLPETRGKTLHEIEEYFTGQTISDRQLSSEMNLMMGKGNDENNK